MQIIDELRDAISNAIAPILQDQRGQLLGDFAFIASTLSTDPDDSGNYVSVFSDNTPPHAQIGLVRILADVAESDD